MPMQRADKSSQAPSVFPEGHRVAFALVTLAFFLWGFSNNLTDILVQQFRKSFELTLFQAQLVQTANFLAYGMMAIPAALLTRRFGYKRGMLTGLCVFATGTLLFWPAAHVARYGFFLVALFTVGCGLSILETTCNPMVAQFGDPATSERRLNYAQALNPPGTIAGLLFGTWFIFSGVEKRPAQVQAMKAAGTYAAYLHGEILRVVPTYVVLGCAVLLLAALIARTRFPASFDPSSAEDGPPSTIPSEPEERGDFRALLRYPHFIFAVMAQFAYVGAQVGTWSNLIPYFQAYTPLSTRAAGYLLTLSLVALAIGRFVTTPIMRYISPAKLAAVYAVINMALLTFGVTHPGLKGGYAIMSTSFFMSILFPTIFALGVKGLGPHTKLGGSFLVMAIVGGAVFPLLMGLVSDRSGSLAMGYAVPLAGYFVVAVYGFFAGRRRTPSLHEIHLTPEAL